MKHSLLTKSLAVLLLLVPLFAASQTKTLTIKGSNDDPGDVIEVESTAEVGITVNADGIVLTMPGIDLRTKCLGDITASGYCFIAASGLPANTADTDMDGVPNINDVCPSTPFGSLTDRQGCAESEQDDDGDGVPNGTDQCANTPSGAVVDQFGCSNDQQDGDNDGVTNALDQCANTPVGQTVNAQGCSLSQLDTDGDGVSDADDNCPGTAGGATVDNNGCSEDQLGSSANYCANAPSGVICSSAFNFDPFHQDNGEIRNIEVPARTVLSVPFTLPASTTDYGTLQFTTADDAPTGYAFRLWYSTTPGGTPLVGAGCDQLFDARGEKFWSQNPSVTGGNVNPICALGNSERILYANFSVVCNQSASCTVGQLSPSRYFFDVARNVFPF